MQPLLFKDRKRPAPLESSTLRACKKYLAARGIYFLRLNSGAVKKGNCWIELCPTGTPDLFFLYKGISCFVETKRVGKEPTPEQLETHKTILRSGGRILVAQDVNELIAFLKELDAKL